MRTKQQYIEKLLKLDKNLYYQGGKVGRDHEDLEQGHRRHRTQTFDAAADPEMADLCTAVSHLTGQKINRFCHIHQTPEDLHRKQDMTRALCRKVGYCIGRCMGIDATNAVNAISFEADKMAPGETNYHRNFLNWLENFQGKRPGGLLRPNRRQGRKTQKTLPTTGPGHVLTGGGKEKRRHRGPRL